MPHAGRGLFIVFEGVDRAGKSTQVEKLVTFLRHAGWKCQRFAFPYTGSLIGSLLSEYLKGSKTVPKECTHLLFCANRWEQRSLIESLLNDGVTIVCDRYSYSGIAYSVGVHNLNAAWCWTTETGLPKPDIVYQLCPSAGDHSARLTDGEQRFDKIALQTAVAEAFSAFHSEQNWVVVPSPPPCGRNLSDTADSRTLEQKIEATFEFIADHLSRYLSAVNAADSRTVFKPLQRLGFEPSHYFSQQSDECDDDNGS